MNIIPAEVAGVKRIVMVTPPGRDGKVNPVTLTAAHLAGASEVYKAGGAQAVAALAFGTESVSYTHLDVYKRQYGSRGIYHSCRCYRRFKKIIVQAKAVAD